MTLNFFNTPEKVDTKRIAALRTVREWFHARPYLPRELRLAMLFLLPELKGTDENDFPPDDESPEE